MERDETNLTPEIPDSYFCPNQHPIPYRAHLLNGSELYCLSCDGGRWYDRSELQEIKPSREDRPSSLLEKISLWRILKLLDLL